MTRPGTGAGAEGHWSPPGTEVERKTWTGAVSRIGYGASGSSWNDNSARGSIWSGHTALVSLWHYCFGVGGALESRAKPTEVEQKQILLHVKRAEPAPTILYSNMMAERKITKPEIFNRGSTTGVIRSTVRGMFISVSSCRALNIH